MAGAYRRVHVVTAQDGAGNRHPIIVSQWLEYHNFADFTPGSLFLQMSDGTPVRVLAPDKLYSPATGMAFSIDPAAIADVAVRSEPAGEVATG